MIKGNATFFIIVFIGALLGGLALMYFTQEVRKDTADLPTVIEAEYQNKIVYTSDASFSEDPFKNHCELQGGTFNACGSPCAPDAEVCIEVCAYTCDL